MQTQTALDQRSSERYEVEIPLTLKDGDEAATHNLSSSGLMIDASSAPEIGAEVDMTLRYFVNGQDFALPCTGEVVRVERRGNGYRVAVKLHQPLFTRAELAFLP